MRKEFENFKEKNYTNNNDFKDEIQNLNLYISDLKKKYEEDVFHQIYIKLILI